MSSGSKPSEHSPLRHCEGTEAAECYEERGGTRPRKVCFDKLLVMVEGALRPQYGDSAADIVQDGLGAMVEAELQRDLSPLVQVINRDKTSRYLKSAPMPEGHWARPVRAVDRALTKHQPAVIDR